MDMLFSDTLDNFSFSDSGNLWETNFNPTSGLEENVSNFRGSKEKSVTPKSRVNSSYEISLDDSVFFAESFSPLTNNKIDQSCDIDSEDIFSDSENSFDNLYSTHNLQHSKYLNSRPSEIQNSLHSKSWLQSNLCPNELDVLQNCKSTSETDKCSMFTWGLPSMVLEKYVHRNITSMFAWQTECLSCPDVLDKCKNLVYSAPTSAGKTLVAEILAIKTLFERKKKVLFILPFVSVVREKMFYFQDILNTSGIRVEGFMGSYNPPGGFHSIHVAICTIEKANSLVNRLLDEGTLSDVGTVIIDEIHLVGDPNRGYLLELLLTKLKYMSLKDKNVNIQIIGMSATLPNLETLARWLDAELYTTTFRPVPLYELFYMNGDIYDNKLQFKRKVPILPDIEMDTDNILHLCLETIENSCSVLIFCPTKSWCENLAQQIASAFWKLGNSKSVLGELLRQELNSTLISEVLEQLKRCPVGLDKILGKIVSFGVAFHHAGLTMDERDIIEGGFRSNILRVLVATSTLSSGVNLPARRVIIRSPIFNGKPINILSYKQMIGRAGRMGKDSAGESILICQKNDYKIIKELMSADLERIESCLLETDKLKRAILEVTASGVASTPNDINLFTNCTLLAIDKTNLLDDPIDEAIKFLENNEFIRLQISDYSSHYIATPLGKACLSSSLPPEEGIALFTELEKARQCFVLETELHLIYLVTPYSACNQWTNIDWLFYLEMWEKLPSCMKRVGELIGVEEPYIMNASRGKMQVNTNQAYKKLQIYKRFYTALALQELVNEVPLNDVAVKFKCSRGMLQSLQQSASTFAGMVTLFSKQLGWTSVEILISQFQGRLHFGVNYDLLDLMRLPLLNGRKARTLYNNGIETLVDLASSDRSVIETILHKVLPFESEKERDGESEYEAQRRNKLRTVWITGQQGLTEQEAAEMLVNEARQYLKFKIGLTEAKWEKSKSITHTHTYNSKESDKLNTTDMDLNSNMSANKNLLEINCRDSKKNIDISQVHSSVSGDLHKNVNSKISWNRSISLLSIKSSSKKNCKNIAVDFNSTDESLFFDDMENLTLNKSVINSETKQKDNKSKSYSNVVFLEDAFSSSFNISAPSEFNNADTDNIVTSPTETDSSLSVSSLKKRCRFSDKRNSIEHLLQQTQKKQKLSNLKTSTVKLDADTITKERIVSRTIPYKLQTKIPADLTKLEIIDVCDNSELFDRFCKEIELQNEISLSLACVQFLKEKQVIGHKIIKSDIKFIHQKYENTDFTYNTRRVKGISITWGGNTAYYVNFHSLHTTAALDLLKRLFKLTTLKAKIFDCKEQIKVLKLCCNVDFDCVPEDPKVGDWLLEPEGKEKNLQAMAMKYSPEVVNMAQMAGCCKGVTSIGLDLHSSIHPRIRSSIEAVTTWHMTQSLLNALAEQDMKLLHTYYIEMNILLILAKMELVGINLKLRELHSLSDILKDQLYALERKGYELAGRHFSFSSTIEVAKILGLYKGKRVSVNKHVLEQSTNPVAGLILQWRKLNNTLSKIVYPMLHMVKNDRLHGCCIVHNATGRISMHEPNLQNVPRDFEIFNPIDSKTVFISCRSAFACSDCNILLSADYCQLELRLLAHLSKDLLLCTIMKSDEDLFKSIAAKLNDVSINEVTDELRRKAKQICYGIIYGMGLRCLSEQMNVSEEDANQYLQEFHEQYSGIKQYIQATIKQCKEDGYVETIACRRRYLPHINHNDASIRNHAERQAVNTVIQGSAADIVKNAMVIIYNQIQDKFKLSRNKPQLILHLHDELLYEVPAKYFSTVAKIVKSSMEDSVELSVPFPVKIRMGNSWGNLKETLF